MAFVTCKSEMQLLHFVQMQIIMWILHTPDIKQICGLTSAHNLVLILDSSDFTWQESYNYMKLHLKWCWVLRSSSGHNGCDQCRFSVGIGGSGTRGHNRTDKLFWKLGEPSDATVSQSLLENIFSFVSDHKRFQRWFKIGI